MKKTCDFADLVKKSLLSEYKIAHKNWFFHSKSKK
jgi:hypothetical protein